MLNAYEYTKQRLPHLVSQESIDPLDLQYAMQDYARYVAHIMAREYCDQSLPDSAIDECLPF
jgi:hypothetical protein